MTEKQASSESNFEVLHKFYQRIKKLSKIDNAENYETDPPEAKKEINDLIDRAIEKINVLIVGNNSQNLRLFAMKITMFYERSKLLISLGDEKLSQETLITALNMIKDVVSKSEIIFLAFRIINHYAYLLSKQCDYDTSRAVLEYGESIYINAKKETPVIKFFTNDDLFAPEDVAVTAPKTSYKLERLVTNNLQMLGFIYNKQELHEKFAEYHHQVLRRQLEMRDEEVTMWATKSARLASYFLSKQRFKEARHHLSAAINVLCEHEREINAMEVSENKVENASERALSTMKTLNAFFSKPLFSNWEDRLLEHRCMDPFENLTVASQLHSLWELQDLQQKFAEVAKCWVKYGLFLFRASKTTIVTQFCSEPNQVLERFWEVPFKKIDKNMNSNVKETTFDATSRIHNDANYKVDHGDLIFVNEQQKFNVSSQENSGSLPKLLEDAQHSGSINCDTANTEDCQSPVLIFASLSLSKYENRVAASFVETTTEARALFLHTHGWLKRVKAFYNLNEYPMEYVNAILDLSELYRYLAFYEEDIESQYAIQKLRADALETLSTVLREIRPQCYIAVSVELLRELAEVQLEMMGLNLRRIYAAEESVSEKSKVMHHKMEALADMHSRLEQFGENLGDNRATELSILKADEV